MSNVLLSTGAKNAFSKLGLKDLLDGFVLNIYSGTPPVSADNAESGAKLLTLTKEGLSWSADVKQENYFSVTGIGSDGDTIKVTITPSGGSAETFTYTKSSSESTTDAIARAIANLISEGSDYMDAMATTETTESGVILRGKYGGEAFTVNVAVTGSITVSPSGDLTDVVAASYGNGLHFELIPNVSGGTLEKLSGESWKGTVLASGTAQWFRIQAHDDGGGASTSAIRIQGLVGTLADSPLRLAGSTSLVQDTEITVDTFSIAVG